MNAEKKALKKDLLGYLQSKKITQHNPFPEKPLARRLGINDRTVREYVNELIKEGHIILSTSKGLWIEDDPKVALDYCDRIYYTGMAYMTKQSLLKDALESKGQLRLV